PRLSIQVSKALILPDPLQESSLASGAAKRQNDKAQDQPSETSVSSSSIPPVAIHAESQGSESDAKADADTRSGSSPSIHQTASNDGTLTEEHFTSLSDSQHLIGAAASALADLPKFKAAVDDISSATRTAIALLSSPNLVVPTGQKVVEGFGRQDVVELQVTGSWENAEAARPLLLVAIDTLKPGIISEKLTVELKFQNMIGGRKRQDLQELMAQTRTSIYLTSPLVQTANKSGTPVDSRSNEIYITGEAKQVAIAKNALLEAYRRAQSASLSCTRQVSIATPKLDWMLLNHREKLRTIMTDNATFIAFPPLGGTHPTISVYGESNVNVERTIRTVMQLSCLFHSGFITIRDIALPIHVPQTMVSLTNICKHVSMASGADVEYRNNGFLMFGSEVQIRMAMQALTDADIVKALPSEFKFSVELANEHREFISGKKNGKINRIMKATGAKIKFDQCNEYNFYVDVSSTIAVKAMEALALLQEELPAEISFFVPETYHKRIIGVGGKNIQRIMKKYGVYVKFSNSEEFATLGGYFDNLDNVVARTPSKNALNLENLKQAVMELVNARDKDFVTQRLVIPKHQHLPLLSDHAVALKEIHEATNATILFPARELGSDIVTISGPESLIQQAATMLLSMVDERYVFSVKHSMTMSTVLALPEFRTEVVDTIKQTWNMTLTVPQVGIVPTSVSSSASSSPRSSTLSETRSIKGGVDTLDQANERKEPSKLGEGKNRNQADHVFVYEYTRNNEDYLREAKALLVQFLVSHDIEVHERELQIPRPRSSSLGEPLVHFHSRATLSSIPDHTPVQTASDYALFNNTTASFDSISGSAGIIGAGGLGTSDIRAIFTPPHSNLPPLDTTPSRWSDHGRLAGAMQGSPSTHSAGASASGSSFGLGSGSIIGQGSSSTMYSRVTSLPADPWAPSKQIHRQSQPSSGYLGSIGDLRSISTGTPHSSGYYSPGGYPQAALESAFNKSGFQTPGSSTPVHRYPGGDSPIQGPTSTSIGDYSNGVSHQGSPQSSQRMSTISTSSRSSVLLEDKMLSGAAFGPGYGPSLNSGNGRSALAQQQTPYQQTQSSQFVHHSSLNLYPQQQQQQQQQPQQPQQHGMSGQVHPSHLHIHQNLAYPQQRQRHSSQNSAASHHTMGLGHIGGGPGSAGGSVNSDEFSTEEDSDEVFDEMRNRQRMQSAPTSLFPQAHLMTQGYYQSSLGGGYEGYSSHNSSSSSLLNRRGSAGSTHSIGIQQQQLYSQASLDFPAHLGNGSAVDLYGQNALVSAMEKHTISGQSENDMGVGGGRSSQSRIGQGRQSAVMSSVVGTGLPSALTGSRFEDERSFFSSGFGGIIGEGVHHGYGQANGSTTESRHASTSSFGSHTLSMGHQGNMGSNMFGGFGGNSEINGLDTSRAGMAVTSELSATAMPFYMDSALHHKGPSSDRSHDGSRDLTWDR
ncbi:hypothetical protein BGX31_006920, partial [Mortierella sp. GBA43]